MSDPAKIAVPVAASALGALQAYFRPNDGGDQNYTAHYRDPSTAPTLTVVGGPDRAPSCSSTSPTSRLGSDRSTCPWRGSNRRGDPIDRVGVRGELSEQHQSREQNEQSARALTSEVRAGLALNFRICGRVAGAPYLAADDRRRIPRSGSA
jgi:hypothetical protein